ncbi:MAG: hypothetical protein ACYC5K_10185 [Saccharofermentanales bacterium]
MRKLYIGRNHQKINTGWMTILLPAMLFLALSGCSVPTSNSRNMSDESGSVASSSGSDLSADNSGADVMELVTRTFSISNMEGTPASADIQVFTEDLGEPDRRSFAVRREVDSSLEPQKAGIYLNIFNEPVEGGTETVIQKMAQGEHVWTYRISAEFFASGYLQTAEGFYIYGTEYAAPGDVSVTYGKLILLDDGGHLLWETDDSSKFIEYHTAIAAEDGIIIFGRRIDNRSDSVVYSMVRKYDRQGQLVFENEQKMTSYYWASGAAFINGKYYVTYLGQGTGILVSILENGEFMEQYRFFAGGKEYTVQDVKAYNGRLYLSCSGPDVDETSFGESLNELLSEYYNAWEANSGTFSDIDMPAEYSGRLSSLFRDQYHAALLICTPDAAVEKIVEIDRSKAGTLSVEGEKLLWHVSRIDVAENALPVLSSRRIEIAATGFELTLDSSGAYLDKSATGFEEIWY